MASRATQVLTTGVKILGGTNITAFTLEFLTDAKKHYKGSYETIAVPYIELGRGKRCGIKFYDDTPTVSRRHSSIEKSGSDYIIKHLSETNPTLINGKEISSAYMLHNGDEIQLSWEGPRLRFNQTQTGTSKMGYTQKLNLVMQQAIRPYKSAVISLFIFLLLSLSGLGYGLKTSFNKSETLKKDLELTRITMIDSISFLVDNNNKLNDRLQSESRRRKSETQKLNEQLNEIKLSYEEQLNELSKSSFERENFSDYYKTMKPFTVGIFLDKIEVEYGGSTQVLQPNEPNSCMCTGFILDGGKFVTAQHCIDMTVTDENLAVIVNAGGTVTGHFMARSADGNIRFEFTTKDMEFDVEYADGSDWAYMQTNYSDGAKFNYNKSKNLDAGEYLVIMGYSYGSDFRDPTKPFDPYFSSAKVAVPGLQYDQIYVTEFAYDNGNSGGPCIAIVDGVPEIVGIVSLTFIDQSRFDEANIGALVPIANFE